MKRTGKYYWLTVGAYTSLTLGMIPILLFTGLVANNTYGISIGLVIGGFSNGIGVTTSLIALIANAAQEDQAVATACSYLFRSLGSVVGVSLTASVVQQALRVNLEERLKGGRDAGEVVKRVRESLEYLKTLDPETREVVRRCYGDATTVGFGLMIGIAAFAAVSSCKFFSFFFSLLFFLFFCCYCFPLEDKGVCGCRADDESCRVYQGEEIELMI